MKIPILLGHNDVLTRLGLEGDSTAFFMHGADGKIDLPRSREGSLAGGFFAVWVPTPEEPPGERINQEGVREEPLASPIEPGYARHLAERQIGKLHELEQRASGALAIARNLEQLVAGLESEAFVAMLHFEGAEPIEPDLSNLDELYGQGLRSLGLVWSRPNLFGHGVQFRFPSTPDTGPGLSRAGAELVRACNELGVMLDTSHLNENGFWDIVRLSRAPVVASHSNAHALCPSSRNLTDEQLRAIRDSGGVVGINFSVSNLRPDGKDDPHTPLELLYRQADYLAELIGVDHVALGSDYEGDTVPEAIDDVSSLDTILVGLSERGWSPESLEKIAYRNWLRVLGETWRP